MKKLISIVATALCAVSLAFTTPGCANGKWNTGSVATDAALTSAQAALVPQAINLANQVAAGSDIKKALVQASGDAVRSLEGVGITAIQPVITERLLKWVPKSPEWQGYAKAVAKAVDTYVQSHASEPGVLKSALEAVALTLNTY